MRTFRTADLAEFAIGHMLLDVGEPVTLKPSTLDQAGVVVLHLSSADHFELRGAAGALWAGRCTPGAVNVIAGRQALALKTSHKLDMLIVGIPHAVVPPAPAEVSADDGQDHPTSSIARDSVGHELGQAYLAASQATDDASSALVVHLARALCCHFTIKHAWVQDKFPGAGQDGLAPWQADTATRLLEQGDMQVRDVAAACRLSSSSFSRLFRRTFSSTPQEWKAKRRVDAVKELLRDAETSLADAASQAGFADQASMSRAFRRMVGASPGEWRLSQQGVKG